MNLFFKDFIYLFMRDTGRERERERGRDTGRGRSRLHQAGWHQARPRGRGTMLQSVAVYYAIHVHLGVLLILVTRKPLSTPFCPFGAISLRWCPRYHVSSGAASLAGRGPSALRRGLRSTLRASRPDVVLHGGAFYIQLYYFYYYETFPPNSSINTAFQLCGWFWWVAGKE